MKRDVRYLRLTQLFILVIFRVGYAQTAGEGKLLRIYEDNDFFNIRGKGTDKAYSGGTRFDLFYEKKRKPLFVPGFLKIKGDSTVNIGEWGLMQTVFTPNNTSDPYFEPTDYFYSGALFVVHSLYSYNPVRHYSFQRELQFGIRGPAALGKQAQTFIHRLIHYKLPKGWDNQLQNAPVINFNFAFEKQVGSVRQVLEFIAGGKAYMGTLQNGMSFYPLLRVGIMNPYFGGYIRQFSGPRYGATKRKNKIQAYIIIKPEIQWMLNNALLEGGIFAKNPTVKLDMRSLGSSSATIDYSTKIIRNWTYSINYGAVVSTGKFALSFIQNTSTEMRKNTYSHEFGNVSMYIIL